MTSQASERTRPAQPAETSPSVAVAAAVDGDKKKSAAPFLSPQITSYFVAGGVAGAASRTVVSPLERLKIIQCVVFCDDKILKLVITGCSDKSSLRARSSTRESGRVWSVCGGKKASEASCEGMALTVCASCRIGMFIDFSICPGREAHSIVNNLSSAVQFTTYEQLKKVSSAVLFLAFD